jgi:ammonium transporter, Amt family
MKNWKVMLPLALALSSTAFAQTEAAAPWAPDTGSTAWLLVSCALVMLMTPALAFFYGGLVRAKNSLNTMMMSYIALGLVAVIWAVLGYSLAFSHGEVPNLIPGFLGGFSFAFLNGVDGNSPHPQATAIPHNVFMMFQAMFAIITPALISGAIVERMRFKTYLVFIGLWSLLIYSPLAHMVWSNDGFLFKMGALDFAGGTVVHISAGISALVAAIILGPRRGFGRVAMAPHNVPFVLLGAGLLWFGWFGFNAGSALGAGGLAGSAFVATNFGAAAALLTWSILEILRTGKATAVGAATGAVVGLVAITPAAGFVTPMNAILIGAIGALVSFTAIQIKHRVNIDDSLDVFFCHGLGGITGAILTGVFATKVINPIPGADGNPINLGLVDGNAGQIVTQIIGILVAVVLAGGGTALLLYILKAVMGVRPDSRDEETGLDLADHGEGAYHGGEYGVTGGVSPIGSSVTLSVAPNSKAVAGD